jgi:hypothetical protein
MAMGGGTPPLYTARPHGASVHADMRGGVNVARHIAGPWLHSQSDDAAPARMPDSTPRA